MKGKDYQEIAILIVLGVTLGAGIDLCLKLAGCTAVVL